MKNTLKVKHEDLTDLLSHFIVRKELSLERLELENFPLSQENIDMINNLIYQQQDSLKVLTLNKCGLKDKDFGMLKWIILKNGLRLESVSL